MTTEALTKPGKDAAIDDNGAVPSLRGLVQPHPQLALISCQGAPQRAGQWSVRVGSKLSRNVRVQAVLLPTGSKAGLDAVLALTADSALPMRFALRHAGAGTVFDGIDLDRASDDIAAFVRDGVGALPPSERQLVLNLVAGTLAGASPQRRRDLAVVAFSLREMLRERLPMANVDPAVPVGLHVDSILQTADDGVYLQGWLRYQDELTRLTVVSPEGGRQEVRESVFLYDRPDLDTFYSRPLPGRHVGFIAFSTLSAPSELLPGWILEMEDSSGTACEAHAPDAIADPLVARQRILEGLPLAELPSASLMETHVHPAISRLQGVLRGRVKTAAVLDFGEVPQASDVSVVIPLYGRIDFLEHQLAQFVHDPQIAQTQLIYVLDSPELARELRHRATHLCDLYRVPFRVVLHEHSSGYSAANQSGACASDGRLLLFLNSDVFPCAPGWLSKMVAFYDQTPDVGALGPKLVYEDGSLQHAGMYFTLPRDTALAGQWANVHYFKGFHRQIPVACINRVVPAVTGACLLVDRKLYEQVGGFSDCYVQGDHEDSDLCLRLAALGKQNWYLSDVELYHIEGQSYPSDLRARAALYNRWLHTQLWDATLRTMGNHT